MARRIIVDPQDQALVDEGGWRVRPDGYVVRYVNSETQYLHRVVMGLVAGDPRQVDHKNHIKHDNRRSNLCSRAVNQQNRAGAAKHSLAPGGLVKMHTTNTRYRAQYRRFGKVVSVGRFDTIPEAASALAVAVAR